jgi:hypothetical protein
MTYSSTLDAPHFGFCQSLERELRPGLDASRLSSSFILLELALQGRRSPLHDFCEDLLERGPFRPLHGLLLLPALSPAGALQGPATRRPGDLSEFGDPGGVAEVFNPYNSHVAHVESPFCVLPALACSGQGFGLHYFGQLIV